MLTTRLVSIRKPTLAERKKGAEIVFVRRSSDRREYTILACKCYESWEQWGAHAEVLSDNCPAVERWRREGLTAFEEY